MTEQNRNFAEHFDDAVAWLHNQYAAELTEVECKSIVRVLWSRAGAALKTVDKLSRHGN